jgi:periplasmic protein TonB
MALRCLLFSSDQGTTDPICQVLASLGVETESCSEAPPAIERITSQPFQIVIVDWDRQPEAGFLLTTARARKAAERPLTLAIVSDDASVPKALQAGANSVLRKPILINQVKDTLTTARDLLRAKQEPATAVARVAVAAASATAPAPIASNRAARNEKSLRAGEFLQSAPPAPGAQFLVESDVLRSASTVIDPLKDLEPVAASVAEEKPVPPPPPPGEPRGLQWYLNARAGTLPPAPAAHPPTPPPPAAAKPELIGFDQTPAYAPPSPARAPEFTGGFEPESPSDQPATHEQRAEAKLFSYITGDGEESEQKESSGEESGRSFSLGKGAIIAALVLAACAVAGAPQAPWHGKVKQAWGRLQLATHAWLNPQPVTPAQAPPSHEDFGRAGDEYKLPVAETIPDATTDPSQIRVEPVIDPTAKQPNNADPNAGQVPGQASTGEMNPTDPAQAPPLQPPTVEVHENPPPQPAPAPTQAAPGSIPGGVAAPSGATGSSSTSEPPHVDSPAAISSPVPSAPIRPAPPKNPQPHYASAPTNVPSSLKSQMASMTPDASGNKPVESALPSLEPVTVPEATERGLLADQPDITYPANAKGQQGTVVLQVLIGRDGTVQDAKFMQGSLAFARVAIDGVKQWKFKPYTMNGRAVSVQTLLTLTFKPAS